MQLPHYLHLLVLLPLLDLTADPELHVVGDDVERAVEQHAQMRSHLLQPDPRELFHHLGVVAAVDREEVYYPLWLFLCEALVLLFCWFWLWRSLLPALSLSPLFFGLFLSLPWVRSWVFIFFVWVFHFFLAFCLHRAFILFSVMLYFGLFFSVCLLFSDNLLFLLFRNSLHRLTLQFYLSWFFSPFRNSRRCRDSSVASWFIIFLSLRLFLLLRLWLLLFRLFWLFAFFLFLGLWPWLGFFLSWRLRFVFLYLDIPIFIRIFINFLHLFCILHLHLLTSFFLLLLSLLLLARTVTPILLNNLFLLLLAHLLCIAIRTSSHRPPSSFRLPVEIVRFLFDPVFLVDDLLPLEYAGLLALHRTSSLATSAFLADFLCFLRLLFVFLLWLLFLGLALLLLFLLLWLLFLLLLLWLWLFLFLHLILRRLFFWLWFLLLFWFLHLLFLDFILLALWLCFSLIFLLLFRFLSLLLILHFIFVLFCFLFRFLLGFLLFSLLIIHLQLFFLSLFPFPCWSPFIFESLHHFLFFLLKVIVHCLGLLRRVLNLSSLHLLPLNTACASRPPLWLTHQWMRWHGLAALKNATLEIAHFVWLGMDRCEWYNIHFMRQCEWEWSVWFVWKFSEAWTRSENDNYSSFLLDNIYLQLYMLLLYPKHRQWTHWR